MASADQVKALLRSHLEDDEDRFYATAMQMAASEARKGHSNYAKELRDLAQEGSEKQKRRNSGRSRAVPIAQPQGDLSDLFSALYPDLRLSNMSLDPNLAKSIERVLREQKHSNRLQSHGLQPRRKILCHGPPGTGKTMLSKVLAGELRLPLFTVRLDGLITKYMGETITKLKKIFDAMNDRRGVYLFDEFDSIGARRDHGQEVGEMRRVLNSFLMYLEEDTSESIIAAATNHSDILDYALFRRFDEILNFRLPDTRERKQLFEDRLAHIGHEHLDLAEATEISEGLSHSEIVKACENATKDAIVKGKERLAPEQLLTAIQERKQFK